MRRGGSDVEIPRLMVAVALLVAVASCGGGGSSNTSDTPSTAEGQDTASSVQGREATTGTEIPTGSSVDELAEAALALPTRKPDRIDLFTSRYESAGADGLYPEGSPMELAPGPVPSADDVRGGLEQFLTERFADDRTRVAEGLAI